MEITEVRIFKKDGVEKRLRAFATVTIDHCFVVRDVKIVEGSKGLFIAMPSKRIKEACPGCRHRNVAGSLFCNQCGTKLKEKRESAAAMSSEETTKSEHQDIVHPITVDCRAYMQKVILEAYEREK